MSGVKKWMVMCAMIVMMVLSGITAMATEPEIVANRNETIMKAIEQSGSDAGIIDTGIQIQSESEGLQIWRDFYYGYYNGNLYVYALARYHGDGTITLCVEVNGSPKQAVSEHQETLEKIKEIADSVEGDPETTVSTICDTIINQISYDNESASELLNMVVPTNPKTRQYDNLNVTIYSALKNQKTICLGYAELFHRLCKEKGLESAIIMNGNHAYNMVIINDTPKVVDLTNEIFYNSGNFLNMQYADCVQKYPDFYRADYVYPYNFEIS